MDFKKVVLAASMLISAMLVDGKIIFNNSILNIYNTTGSTEINLKTGMITKINNTTASAVLWEALYDNKKIKSSQFNKVKSKINKNEAIITYKSADLKVVICIKKTDNTLNLSAEVTNLSSKPLKGFMLPGRMKFNPDNLVSLISGIENLKGIGSIYYSSFFKPYAEKIVYNVMENPQREKAYKALYGSEAIVVSGAPVSQIKVSDEGKKWFSARTIKKLERLEGPVTRPFGHNQLDGVLFANSSTPMMGYSKLGGEGKIFRLATWVKALSGKGAATDPDLLEAYKELMEKVIKDNDKPGRNAIAFIDIKGLPSSANGGFVVKRLKETFNNVKTAGNIQKVYLQSEAEVIKAIQDKSYLFIINPNAEISPLYASEMHYLKDYIRTGGVWFETGGYSFYYRPERIIYAINKANYPGRYFADFNYFNFTKGRFSLFHIFPMDYPAWSARKNKEHIFTEMRAVLGADKDGGYLERIWLPYLKKDQSWKCPQTRFLFNTSVRSACDMLCETNKQNKKLHEKINIELYEKLKSSFLIKLTGDIKDYRGKLHNIPGPAIIHNSDYLRYGFDKGYPDHLPPNKKFGTSDEFKNFIKEIHDNGFLYMPYTNNSWWCDNPKGETFLKRGKAGLVIKEDGELVKEEYLRNTGYKSTYWHPFVQEANRKITRLFTEEYPADILFQDQMAGRNQAIDMNPASPTPYAYSEGKISMLKEDSAKIPLATEESHFSVMNYEVMFCGHERSTIPPGYGELLRSQRIDNTWNFFPLYQMIAHDKVIMTLHDLRRGATNDEKISWLLAWGFSMNYAVYKNTLNNPYVLEWLTWLSEIQQNIAAKYTGKKLVDFKHEWGKSAAIHDSGWITAQYGDYKICSNLSPETISINNYSIPPYGFRITGPGLWAGCLKSSYKNCGYIITKESQYVYRLAIFAKRKEYLNIPFPGKSPRRVKLTFPDGMTQILTIMKNKLRFTNPQKYKRYGRVVNIIKIEDVSK